jgi:alkyl hydroperoxide reductase subunit AhpC
MRHRRAEGEHGEIARAARLDRDGRLRKQRHAEAVGDHLHERREARRAHLLGLARAGVAAHRERLIAQAVPVLEQQHRLAGEIGLANAARALARQAVRGGHREQEGLVEERQHVDAVASDRQREQQELELSREQLLDQASRLVLVQEELQPGVLAAHRRQPSVDLKAVVSTDAKTAFKQVSDKSDAGKWKVVFFWPKDFTFVCPTEIAAFGKLNKDFAERDAVVYGVSTDSEFVHLAWRQNHADLKALPFAMLADIKRELSQELGILDKSEGVCLRATFIVDPEGIIRFVSVNDLSVGRNPQEVLRVLDALQTDELCPCNWPCSPTPTWST